VLSKNKSWPITILATSSLIGTPRNIILSIINLEKISIAAIFNGLSSIILGVKFVMTCGVAF
jgi:hypothetical protein